MKRIVPEKVADERTYEKLKRELDVLPVGHPRRKHIQREHEETKSRMRKRE